MALGSENTHERICLIVAGLENLAHWLSIYAFSAVLNAAGILADWTRQIVDYYHGFQASEGPIDTKLGFPQYHLSTRSKQYYPTQHRA